MSTSDDDLENKEGKADDGDERKKTLRGLGLKVPRPPTPKPRKRRTVEDFAEEATEIAREMADEVIGDIDALLAPPEPGASEGLGAESSVDEAWEDMFPDEKTQVAESELVFPEDERDAAEIDARPADASPPGGPPEIPMLDVDPIDEDDTPEDGHFPGLDEDSLPEPIRERIPTLEPSVEPLTERPSGVSGPQRIPEGDGDLPAPIRQGGAPMAFRGGEVDDADDDFHAGATEVLDSPFESDPAVAKLVALDGPAAGLEVFVSGLRNTVGRGTNNSVVVADLAMSRQHFEIVKNPDESFTLHDLQSINGTLLNGTKVREGDLFHGDRVEAGKSLFQFVVTGNAPMTNRQRRVVPAASATMGGSKPQPMPQPASANSRDGSVNKMLLWVSVTAVLVSLLLIAALVLLKLQDSDEPQPQAEGPTASAVYLDGVEAVKAREWDLAESSFEKAQKLDPSLDGIEDQLRRIELERQAQTDLETARRLFEQGMFSPASDKVQEIPRDSLYFAEARDLLRQGRKAEIERLYANAQRALTDEDIEGSKSAIAAILDRVPNHQGARTLEERIEAIESGEQTVEEAAEATRVAVATQAPDRAPAEGAEGGDENDGDEWGIELVGLDEEGAGSKTSRKSGGSRKKARGSKPSRSRVPNFTDGFLLYKTRKFSEAEKFFADAAADGGPAADRADRIAAAVADFESNYSSGTSAFSAGRWGEAEKKFEAAQRADSTVGDYFAGELKTKLATVRAKLGLAELDAGNTSSARKFYEEARRLNADDSSTRQLGERLEKEAISLYIKAQNLRKSNPANAAKICRTIMRLVPESNETHQKASELLKSL